MNLEIRSLLTVNIKLNPFLSGILYLFQGFSRALLFDRRTTLLLSFWLGLKMPFLVTIRKC